MSDNRSNPEDTRAMMQEAEGLYSDACNIIEQARAVAYRAVNEVLIKRNWLLGMRIQHEVLKDKRAEYGKQVVKLLAAFLTKRFGEGFTKTNLYNYIAFYQYWPEFFHAESGLSAENDIENIFHAASGKSEKCPINEEIFDGNLKNNFHFQ